MNPQNRQKLLIILTLVVVGLYVADLLVFEPLAKWYSARNEKIATLRQQVKDGTRLQHRAAGLQSEWDNMRTNTLPTNGSLAEQQLLTAFDGWASESGAEITDILSQWKSDADDYVTLNCRVEAGGNLNSLMQFLYSVKRGPMALKLDSLQLSSRDTTGQLFTLDLQLSGLVLVAKSPSQK